MWFTIKISMKRITFIPVGGLGNRMRSIAAALTLANKTTHDLRVFWFRDWALCCRFDELFCPLPDSLFTLVEGDLTDSIRYDRPRLRNLFIPALYQQATFNRCLYEHKVHRYSREHFNFEQWATANSCYLASYSAFYPVAPTRYAQLFQPIPPIEREIKRRCSAFSAHTVGIHIRRADHVVAIKESPIELFIEKMEEEIQLYPSTKFYVATDSEVDREKLQAHFGERILTSPFQADRNSKEGIQDAVADLYTLSQTCKIYGSMQSTFSLMASWLRGVDCIVLQQQHPQEVIE